MKKWIILPLICCLLAGCTAAPAVRESARAVPPPPPPAEAETVEETPCSCTLDVREREDSVQDDDGTILATYRMALPELTARRSDGSAIETAETAAEARALAAGDGVWMLRSGRELAVELYSKMRSQGLRPRTIVDYTREAFVYAPGNVRVTLDYDIRTGLGCTDFLDMDCVTVPAGDAPAILEVKWDAYLPAVIQDAVQLPGRRAAAFSKYAICRIYG